LILAKSGDIVKNMRNYVKAIYMPWVTATHTVILKLAADVRNGHNND